MKILSIMSSPHKDGNTAILMNKILNGLKSASSIQLSIEKINLTDLNLKPCVGCYECMDTLYCKICPDASDVVKKIIESHLIIIGTPIFFFNMTSYLKLLWDHFIMITHPKLQSKLFNKKFVLFTVAGSEYEDIAESFYRDAEETARFFNFDIVDRFKIGGFLESGEVKKDKSTLTKAFDFGKMLSKKTLL
ncbi:MAG: flavodoxin family protein [Promethearchaeota archaeon]|nr:MAG: flavodoxin family protein [Candidatus Lokiarchaeota archaeon]